eukprot:s3820_g1.t1
MFAFAFTFFAEAMEADKGTDSPFMSEASTSSCAEAKALGFTSRCPLQEYSVEELTEWAKKEGLGFRFQSGLEEIVRLGGLHVVNDKKLLDLGIMLPAIRKKILQAIRRKLAGNRKVRFGEVRKFEPILHKQDGLEFQDFTEGG